MTWKDIKRIAKHNPIVANILKLEISKEEQLMMMVLYLDSQYVKQLDADVKKKILKFPAKIEIKLSELPKAKPKIILTDTKPFNTISEDSHNTKGEE